MKNMNFRIDGDSHCHSHCHNHTLCLKKKKYLKAPATLIEKVISVCKQ